MEFYDLNKLFLLNETLVEKLFNIFTDDFKLKNEYSDLDRLKNKLQLLIRNKKDLKLTFELDKKNEIIEVKGNFLPNPNEITITFPNNHKFSAYDVLSIFFHEYSHYIKETIKPGRFNPPRKDQIDNTGYIHPPKIINNLHTLIGFTDPMVKLLFYYTQTHERSSVAFTIAYDIYTDNPTLINDKLESGSDVIDKLINSHEMLWDKHYNNKQQMNHYQSKLESPGSKWLFYMIVYYSELKRLNLQEDQEYIKYIAKQLYKTVSLVKKYYRRLFGVMKYAKQNKNKLSIFRVGDQTDQTNSARFPGL